ncbi:MAG: hypothetical protein ABSB33_03370 [Tepidisphaeraceae bacterium]|jgi:hypothetical protein
MKQGKAKLPSGLVQPAFVVVAATLLLSLIAFNGFVWNLKLHFKKDSVPQRQEFREIPALMGHWLQISQDDKLDKETEDILGTEQYIYRDYIQVDRAGADLVALVASGFEKTAGTTQPSDSDTDGDRASEAARAKFNQLSFDGQVRMINDALKGKTPTERKEILTNVEIKGHLGDNTHVDVVHLGLTYYTGLVDTVAHIPDRCYIADGYEPSSYTVPTWNLGPDAAGKIFPLPVRFIAFEDSTGNNRVSKCVAYVFHTNGHYESDPLGVRQTLEDLTERYGYYAKIELMTLGQNTDAASSAMTEFLTAARPEIETCLPDWSKIKQSH